MTRAKWWLLLLLGCVHTGSSSRGVQTRALVTEAKTARREHRWADCGRLFAQADHGVDAARCHALAGQPDAAFAQLERAIAQNDLSLTLTAFDHDDDLRSLQLDARWAVARTHLLAVHAPLNAELADLYQADQDDRRDVTSVNLAELSARDAARKQRVAQLLDAGAAKVAGDYAYAAMVFQHGESLDDFARAKVLATQAVALDPSQPELKRLIALAEDRRLMTAGLPQKRDNEGRGATARSSPELAPAKRHPVPR